MIGERRRNGTLSFWVTVPWLLAGVLIGQWSYLMPWWAGLIYAPVVCGFASLFTRRPVTTVRAYEDGEPVDFRVDADVAPVLYRYGILKEVDR